jgi:YHS domain-containing protein
MNRFNSRAIAAFCLLLSLSASRPTRAADKPDAANPKTLAADKKALAAFQPYVGQWKGAGQPRHGSSQGAWSEESQWAWHFTDGHAELRAEVSHDPYFSALRLQPGDKPGRLRLIGTASDSTASDSKNESQFEGAVDGDGRLVLAVAGQPKPDQPARITVHLVAGGDRLVILYERRSGAQFARLAEVGYTRKGSLFAAKGADPHECIVTGGHGTIAVDYKGQTYYFCCTGCRDLFKQDPEKVLAEYREWKAKEQAVSK